ncbi:MAG: hypothetical protein HY208_06585 [Nitrospirae bacterium]|nr:hypothetical protein [Nitrospirota bacterium]
MPSLMPRAAEPFRFFTRSCLTLMTGRKAKDLNELVDYLKTASEPVIYQHTHRFLRQHQYLVPEPSNDFAYWTTHMLQDERLGERLAAIDTVRFHSLNDLRRALVSTIEQHLGKDGILRQAPEGKEFHFMSAVQFSVPIQYQAHDLVEFRDCLSKVGIASLYLHIFEAMLRPPLGTNDFSHWLDTSLHETELAGRMAGLDLYSHTLEELRATMIGFIEGRLQELSHAEA